MFEPLVMMNGYIYAYIYLCVYW